MEDLQFLKEVVSPGWGAQVVGALSHTPKGFRSDSPSGHMPRLWVRTQVRVHTRGKQPIDVSLFPPPSLYPQVRIKLKRGGLKQMQLGR